MFQNDKMDFDRRNLSREKTNYYLNILAEHPELIDAIEPKNNEMAVASAAFVYNKNISYSSDPLKIYQKIVLTGLLEEIFKEDHQLNYLQEKNPWILDFQKNYDSFFDPIILFLHEDKLFLEKECLYGNVHGKNLERIENLYKNDNFYCGFQPEIYGQAETHFQTHTIEEISEGELICFGIKRGFMKFFSVEDLVNLFEAKKDFCNPLKSTDKSLSGFCLKKLRNICEYPYLHFPKLSQESLGKWLKLKNLIRTVENLKMVDSEKVRDFLDYHQKSNISDKIAMEKNLECLMKMGLYMRGWNGTDSKKRAIEVGDHPKEFFWQISCNVTDEYTNFMLEYQTEIGEKIGSLPLVLYNQNMELIISNPIQGKTIIEKIKIITNPDELNFESSSCIRISSNWIISSVHYYSRLIGSKSDMFDFDIKKLRYIF